MLGMMPKHFPAILVNDRFIDLLPDWPPARGHGPASDQPIRYEFPPALDWSKPAELGQALATFMAEHSLTTPSVAVGLPARWLMSLTEKIPSTDAAVINSALQLALTRRFAGDASRWSFDYLATTGKNETSLFLLGMNELRRQQLLTMLQAAKLKPLTITSAAINAIHLQRLDPPEESWIHWRCQPHEQTFLVGQSSAFSHMHYLARINQAPDLAAGEIRRWLIGLESSGQKPIACIRVDDLEPRSEQWWASLRQSLGRTISLSPKPPTDATALIWAARHPRQTVDFRRPRLQSTPQRKWSRQRLLAIVSTLALLALLAAWLDDWHTQSQRSQAITQELASMKKTLETARWQSDRLMMVRRWLDRRPAALETLMQLTASRSSTGNLWLTNLAWRDDATMTLSGRASDEAAVIDLIGRLGQSPAFHDVKLLYLRQAERTGTTVSFAVSLGAKP